MKRMALTRLALAGAMMAGLATSAVADGMDRSGSIKDAPVAAAPFSWKGHYFGAHIGVARTEVDVNDIAYNGGNGFSHDASTAFGGVQFGVNWQSGSVVGGIEVDLGYLGANSRGQFPGFVGDPTRIGDSIAGINGGPYAVLAARLGFAAGRTLFYAKAGFAFASLEASYVDPNPTGAVLTSGTHNRELASGFAVGGGIEHAISDKWTIKGEYLFMDFGTNSHTAFVGAAPVPFSHDIEVHTFKIGLNYKF